MKIEVVAHDPKWFEAFEEEAAHIAVALGENIVAIHHIGSTSISSIYAKPIIDFLVEVQELAQVDANAAQMEALGYEVMGEMGIAGRRYFRKETPEGVRTHHIHAFVAGADNVERHLAFRDYLRAHPEEAQPYSDLKRTLATQFPNDIYGYMAGKDSLIKALEKRALAWRRQQMAEEK